MKIYIVPTQHWDPFWTHGADVSEKMGVRNLRKALDIIRKRPDFKYTVSQVYLWELFQKRFPERVEEFRQRVKEGKIVLACGGYIDPDFNLPSGESLIRQLSFAKRVWQEEFGVNTAIVWIQDSFGQPASLPQIFLKMGLKFHSSKRGPKKDLPAVFIWQGVDGSQIIFEQQPIGHHGICLFPEFSLIPNKVKPWEWLEKIASFPPLSLILGLIALYLPDFHVWQGTKGRAWSFKSALKYTAKFYRGGKVFIPHGFGVDGAMPVGYISFLCKLYTFLSKDDMFVASPEEFFQTIDEKDLEIIRGELNGPRDDLGEPFGVLPGTYSSRIDVKQRAKTMEKLLYIAELLETIKFSQGSEYKDFSEIWKLKFLTDFHDGICGSLTDNNYQLLKDMAESIIGQCRRIIAENLKNLSPQKAVFNPLPWPRTDLVRIADRLELVSSRPLGVYPVETGKETKTKFEFNEKEKILITPFYRVDWKEGLKISQNGKLITGDDFARFRLQEERGDTYFWDISQDPKDWLWDTVQSAEIIEQDGVRSILKTKGEFPGIKISQKIHFYLHTHRVDFVTNIDNSRENIRLQVNLPFNFVVENGKVIREIPAGFLQEGESPGQSKWRDALSKRFGYYDNMKCVQNWLYFDSQEESMAVFNDGLPEHELTKNGCLITLLRCVGRVGTEGRFLNKFKPKNVPWRAGGPHVIPLAQLQGNYEFKYAFYPGKREDAVRECYEFLFPLEFCHGSTSSPQEAKNNFSLFSISDKNIIPLAVKKAERGNGFIIRLLETEGKGKEIEVRLNPAFKSGAITDLMEEKIYDLVIKNNTIKLQVKPQEIVTLLLGN